MLKRHVQNTELSIVILLQDQTERGTLRADSVYHIMRNTVNGNRVGACDVVRRALDLHAGYYSVPFIPFLADSISPSICYWCAEAIDLERRLQRSTQ